MGNATDQGRATRTEPVRLAQKALVRLRCRQPKWCLGERLAGSMGANLGWELLACKQSESCLQHFRALRNGQGAIIADVTCTGMSAWRGRACMPPIALMGPLTMQQQRRRDLTTVSSTSRPQPLKHMPKELLCVRLECSSCSAWCDNIHRFTVYSQSGHVDTAARQVKDKQTYATQEGETYRN